MKLSTEKLLEPVGKIYGLWLVTGLAPKKARHYFYRCKCSCGNIRNVDRVNLLSGRSRSCGCFELSLKTQHGMTGMPIHRTWGGMKNRCLNPNNPQFKNYGGRGIKVCERWLESFENFYADMGDKPSPNHSLERKDNEMGYSPDNCIWATPKEQARNTRVNVLVTIEGETKTLAEWSEQNGIDYSTLWRRHKSGWHGASLLVPLRRQAAK